MRRTSINPLALGRKHYLFALYEQVFLPPLYQLPDVSRIYLMTNSFGEQAHVDVVESVGITNERIVLNSLSPGAWAIHQVIAKLCSGDPTGATRSVLNKLVMGVSGAELVSNRISLDLQRIQQTLQTISSEEITALQNALIELASIDIASGVQSISQSLNDLPAHFHSPAYDIYLDGIPIKNKISNIAVSYSQDSVHNSIEVSSINPELFSQADPVVQAGTSRIELQVGSRVLYFLLEERTGDEQSFSMWGRSLSARQDSPYAADMDYTIETPSLASEVAQGLVSCALDWQCDDWVLPITFGFSGPPIDGVLTIAQAIGAVVRSRDDGTLVVRAKYPVRPVDMQAAAATVNYDRSLLISIESSETKGTGYNAVEVLGKTTDINLPEMEIEGNAEGETSDRFQGNDVFIRAYWTDAIPKSIDTYVTAGVMTDLGLKTETLEELLMFNQGTASLNHPLKSLDSVEWVGDPGGDVSYEKYSAGLTIENNAYRVARVNYTTEYQRYRLSGHDVEALIAVLSIGADPDVSVLVKIGTGDRPGESVSDALLSTDNIAVVRGTAELDAGIYDQKTITLSAPYDDNAIDGVLAYINDDLVSCTGNFHIRSANISFDGPKVMNEIEVIQCQVS